MNSTGLAVRPPAGAVHLGPPVILREEMMPIRQTNVQYAYCDHALMNARVGTSVGLEI